MLLAVMLLVGSGNAWGQTAVFSDDFSTNTNATYTTSGAIGSSAWSVTGGVDFGARRNTSPAQLELTNDATATTNASGYVFASTALSSFSSPYSSTLSSNIGVVTWTFNFRTNRATALAGFTSTTSYGMAMILVSSSNTPNTTGTGYAVVMGGGGGGTNTIGLIKFINGLQGTKTTIIAFGGAPAALTNYMSVKVTYDPSTNNWTLANRDDGTTAFADPANGSLTSIGSTIADNTYTGTSMSYLGAYWQGSTAATQTSFFDNIKVTVTPASTPAVNINPNTLTGFSYVYGNGPSAEQSFTVSGANLTNDISVTPSTNYEISTGTGGSFVATNPITLTQSGGTVASTTIYVRLKAGLDVNSYNSENISAVSGSLTSDVTCSGSVTPIPLYFRSKATGNWSSTASWESSSDNSTWSDATRTPSSLDYTITIQNSHTVTVDAAVTVDEIVVANGGILNANSSLTVNDGMGDDIIIQSGGTLKYSSSSSHAGFTGTAPTISNETGGIILATTTGIINNIQNTNYIYKNASILEYNGTGAPAVNDITFFPNADERIIPILRFTSSISTDIGGAKSTTINGNLEIISGVSITLASTGLKTIRNGVHLLGTGSLTVNTRLTCASLEVDAGSTLTVSAGKQLTVSTALTNNGTLNLLSDATGTATILTPSTLSGSGSYNVQQYLTGALNSGTGFPNGRFWYVATPVSGVKSDVFDAATDANKLWYYTESAHGYTEITDNTTDLAVGTGYVARLGAANNTVNFSGTGLYTGDKTINLTYNSGNAKSGFNLIGNPYPSFLDWNAVTLTADVMPTIWIRSFSGSAMGFDTYNSATGAGVSSNGNNVTRYIAPMQAFWVEVNASSTISVTNAMRYTQDQTTNGNKLKAPSVNTTAQQLLRLQVTNGANSDEAIIAFNANALDAYDRYDSHKMLNDEVSIPEIYTYAGDHQLAINCMNSMILNKEYALGFSTAETNTFEIKATEINNFDTGTKAILKDKLLNQETELTVGTAYFFASDAATGSDRFSIIFRAAGDVTGVDADKEQNILVYRNGNDRITVVCNAVLDNSSSVSVYNAVGQKLTRQKLTGATTVINAAFTPGVYMVVVNNAGKQQTSKMVIK